MLACVHEQLFGPCGLKPGRKILVAVSGGLDSTALVWALRQLGVPMLLAHAQFHLRGDDSLADQAFIEAMARQWQLPLHVKAFKQDLDRQSTDASLQMRARELRRDWLQKLRKAEDAHAIAMAHHADDQAETILMRLLAGSGIEGLAGMRPRHERILRPMLPLFKAELQAAAETLALPWREDRSNAAPDYWRNRLRLEVLPLLDALRPGSTAVLARSGERFAQSAWLYRQALQRAQDALRLHNDVQHDVWDLPKLLAHPAGVLLLEARLRSLGVGGPQARDIWQGLQNSGTQSGAAWTLPKGRLVLDRKRLHFFPSMNGQEAHRQATRPKQQHREQASAPKADTSESPAWRLGRPPLRGSWPSGRLRVLAMPGRKMGAAQVDGYHRPAIKGAGKGHARSQKKDQKQRLSMQDLALQANPSERVYMDAAALRKLMDQAPDPDTPFLLQPWPAGAYFHPLPGGKKRSLKRYLTDCKVSSAVKPEVLVLACGERILWVPGWGLDRRVAPRAGCAAWEWRWEAR
jgi:tRNA(Ile)-lysidine synthetase-like protein